MKFENNLAFKRKYCLSEWKPETVKAAFDYAQDYKEFLSFAKTERLVVEWVENRCKVLGVRGQNNMIVRVNRAKAVALAVTGKRPLKEGVRIIATHIDSPRIDLKALPLYEEEKLAFFKTQYYGGIKPYQWTALPLALLGTIVKENGEVIKIAIGDQKDEPVLMITDLLPHLSEKQDEKKVKEAILGEDLNALVGTQEVSYKKQETSNKLEGVKQNILSILYEKYGVIEEDLVSAELELVPVGEARDGGLDESLVMGYGHDDRSCTYAAFRAFAEVKDPEYTTVLLLLDKEEIGSEGVTGATSEFVKDFVAGLLSKENPKATENDLRDCLAVSKAISGDVTGAFDPNYKEPSDPVTAVRMGAGVVVEKHTGGRGKALVSEAGAEYTAFIRHILNKNKIIWQPASGIGKVDYRGGGTLGMFFARHNIDVIDMGVPLFNMHAPFEIAHKGDLYSCYQAYKAFLSS